MSSLKEVEKKRRTVFKPLLENPYPQAQFPLIEPQTQSEILEFLLLILEEIRKYEQLRKENFTPQRPECLEKLTLGFNSTVKVLEKQAKLNFRKNKKKTKAPESDGLRYVFVCKADIQPALLTQHFPTLCFTASGEKKVKLVQLPRGALDEVEKKLGSRTGVIGMYHYDSLPTKFTELLEQVGDVSVPWLEDVGFQPLKVKIVETSAPITSKVQKKKEKKN